MRFHGIHPILYAFFGADGALDRAAMRLQVEAALAAGAAGIAVLGLATEVGKLSGAEKRTLVEWAAADVAGRVPLAVTVSGATPSEQTALAGAAQDAGAAWLILQPPPDKAIGEAALQRFFGAVMDRVALPVAIQNAPDYLGIGLAPPALRELAAAHGNFTLLKGEGPATLIRRVIEETEGRLAVFNGRGGLELTDNFRAGCAGIVPAPDCADLQVRIWAAMARGDDHEAERLYREILPAIVFVMQSLDSLVCYGKRLLAQRLGLGPVHDRSPGMVPTGFGLACVERFAARLGPLPGGSR